MPSSIPPPQKIAIYLSDLPPKKITLTKASIIYGRLLREHLF